MYCRFCGSRQEDNAHRCTDCGQLLHETAVAPPQALYSAPPQMQVPYQPVGLDPKSWAPVPNYLTYSVLVTLFCCLPVGIAAIVFSTQVDAKLRVGDRAGALRASNTAKILCIVSAAFLLVFLFGTVGFACLGLVL